MKITFLGTGNSQGIPTLNCSHPVCLSTDKRDKRLRVSILVEWDEYTYVIDCGPDFRYQMLRANVTKINGVLFTHIHSDHTAGLDDLRAYSFQMGAVPVYAQQSVLDNLAMRFEYIFNSENKYPGAPSVQQIAIENKPFELNNLEVVPIEFTHGKLKIFGYKFNNFAYVTDIKSISEIEKIKLKNLDVLVISAVRNNEMHSHLSLTEVLELINELSPKKTYLTHLSHYLGFHAEFEESLPENVYLSYDELVINV